MNGSTDPSHAPTNPTADSSIASEKIASRAIGSDVPDVSDDSTPLWTKSFTALVVMQFLGAMNDNIFRWLLIPIGNHLWKDTAIGSNAALAIGLACFVAPFVLLAVPAGFLADRYSKRTVMIGCKAAEFVVMALGVAAILSGNFWLMLIVLFLMGSQTAMFSPSKYGSIPEMVPSSKLVTANGIIGMTTVVAIMAGMTIGGVLYAQTGEDGRSNLWLSALVLLGVAAVGWAASLFIARLPAANPSRRVPWNVPLFLWRELATLFSYRGLALAAIGYAFFWGVGSLMQLNIYQFSIDYLGVTEVENSYLLGALSVGIAVGSIGAGYFSRGRTELGLAAYGAIGMALFLCVMVFVPPGNSTIHCTGYLLSATFLAAMGAAGGLFNVPLEAFIQHESDPKERGVILAASNVLTSMAMFTASGVFFVLRDENLMAYPPQQIFLVVGLVTAVIAIITVALVPLGTVRVLFTQILRTVYRVRVEGRENIPKHGGAVLVSNHVSYVDALMIGICCPRHVRMIAWEGNFKNFWLGWFGRLTKIIPIEPESQKSILRSLRAAREVLASGKITCIFAEGDLSHDGQVDEFKPGFLIVQKKSGAPVIPVYIDGLWGSIFSREGGKAFWKWPKSFRCRVTVRFGEPIAHPKSADEVHDAVMALSRRGKQTAASGTLRGHQAERCKTAGSNAAPQDDGSSSHD